MITNAMRKQLRDRDYSDEEIARFTPEQAHAKLRANRGRL
jgi:hypothetical protein